MYDQLRLIFEDINCNIGVTIMVPYVIPPPKKKNSKKNKKPKKNYTLLTNGSYLNDHIFR